MSQLDEAEWHVIGEILSRAEPSRLSLPDQARLPGIIRKVQAILRDYRRQAAVRNVLSWPKDKTTNLLLHSHSVKGKLDDALVDHICAAFRELNPAVNLGKVRLQVTTSVPDSVMFLVDGDGKCHTLHVEV